MKGTSSKNGETMAAIESRMTFTASEEVHPHGLGSIMIETPFDVGILSGDSHHHSFDSMDGNGIPPTGGGGCSDCD